MTSRPYNLPERLVTPEALYLNRRQFVAAAALLSGCARADPLTTRPLEAKRTFATSEPSTPLDSITSYNNFYEFGAGKADPQKHAGRLQTSPWTLVVDGLVAKPQRYDVDAILGTGILEERIYRLRCVEGWSMVIPWVGFPLSHLISRAEPLGSAKYMAFETLLDRQQMPGQRGNVLRWPYVEGLRLDEARNPLTLMAVGLYGRTLPNQNGAPIRLVVPWKYGFKSIKSVVRITFTERQPPTSWNRSAPDEYGFYSNVNPDVDHPRWSQATERRIGDFRRRPTLMFNGYGEQVAHMYKGMDLKRWY